MLDSINAPTKNLKFERGTNYQLDEKYILDVYRFPCYSDVYEYKPARNQPIDPRLSSLVTLDDAAEAGEDVLGPDASLSGLMYPLMQSLDEQYLFNGTGVYFLMLTACTCGFPYSLTHPCQCDAQFGAADQRKIFSFARK